jgi:radical SAM superfamily enzyme YgiQ (UPF0313 family)
MRNIPDILALLKEHFPNVSSIAAYGNARSAAAMSVKNILKLREAGLTRIHMGFESGNDEVLEVLNKGVTAAEMKEGATRILEAGVELHLYVLVGAGGKKLSETHIIDSAEFINDVNPHVVELYTLVLLPGTPLYRGSIEGDFQQLSAIESIEEIRHLIEIINAPVGINCSHVSNYCHISGELPAEQDRLLQELRYCASLDEEQLESHELLSISIPTA